MPLIHVSGCNMKAKSAWVAIWFLAGLHLLVLFAGFFAPYSYDTQDRYQPFAPPARIHFIDANGKFHWRPFIYRSVSDIENSTEYKEEQSTMFPLRFVTHGDRYSLLGLTDSSIHLFGVDEPARIYLFGADGFGRDQLSRTLYGGRVSLFAGLLAALLSATTGLVLGGIAGLYGKAVDEVIMRLAEIFIAVPWFYLLLAIWAFLRLQIEPVTAFMLVVGVIGLVGWGRPARLVRGVVLSARERNFVLAARGFGASGVYVLRRHIFPSAVGVILTQIALLVPLFILAEVVLSFLGLGIGEPVPSWGNMLAYAQQHLLLTARWWMLVPGLILIPVFLAYHQLLDNLHLRYN